MRSLLLSKFNNVAVLVIAAILLYFNTDLGLIPLLAALVTIHQFTLLFNSIGHVIPIRFLFGSFMCLQFFVGPILAYHGLDQYQYPLYRMQIGEQQYFAYAFPAVLAFIVGLHITSKDLMGEYIDIKSIQKYVQQNKMMPYLLIGFGFVASIVSNGLPSELAFIFFILGGFKFAGLFMLLVGSKKLQVGPLLLVFGSIISSSLGEGMFHDLLTWMIFAGAIFFIKYRPTLSLKIGLCIVFILLSVVIQQLKNEFRGALRSGQEGSLETLEEAYAIKQQKNGVFSFESLAASNVRINQGFIITNIIKTVPRRVPYANGTELYQILEAAFLPRVIAPNKLNAGDRSIFIKYTGIGLGAGTSMGLSSLGDAYINFGVFGGCIFMFVLGLGYSEIIKVFQKHSNKFPVLILFSPLVFYFPIRPDSELQTLLGHVVKSCFLLFILFRYAGSYFKLKTQTRTPSDLTITSSNRALLSDASAKK